MHNPNFLTAVKPVAMKIVCMLFYYYYGNLKAAQRRVFSASLMKEHPSIR